MGIKINRKWLTVALGLLISVVFLYFAFGSLELGAVLAYIRAVNPVWLALATGVFLLSALLMAARWGFLLRSAAELPLGYLTQLVMIGYMGNNVYPFRTGEVLRILLLQHKYQIALARSATTVVIERIFDGIVMLTFIVVALLFIETPSPEAQAMVRVGAPLFAVAVAIFLGLALRPNWMRLVLRAVGRVLPPRLRALVVENLGEGIIAGLEGLRSPKDLAGAVLMSFASWLVHAVCYWMVAAAFGLSVSYAAMLLAVGLVNLAGLIPASPGMIGVFEYFGGMALIAVGTPPEQAKAFALVTHVVVWLPATLLGFYFLFKQGMRWSDITHARERQPAPPVSA
jgi:uncharacterized protein (TIRG00374 family)